MGLFDKIKGFINTQMKTMEKDNVLVVAIHYIVQEEGWRPIKERFGIDEHEMQYTKHGSSLKKLEITAKRTGSSLAIEFEGEKHVSHGAKVGGFLAEKLMGIDLNIGEKELHARLDLHRYVSNSMEILNESELRNIVKTHISRLEDAARR